MSTVTEICQALKDVITAAVSEVDKASLDDYLPPVDTRKIALLIVPMGLRSSVTWKTNNFTPRYQSHRIPCEFWVKVDKGALSTTMSYAREICLKATRAILDAVENDPELGGVISLVGHYASGGVMSDVPSIDAEVENELIPVGNATYIVGRVWVPVVDFAD